MFGYMIGPLTRGDRMRSFYRGSTLLLIGILCRCSGVDSDGLGPQYPLTVVTPPGYDSTRSYPMILFLHGLLIGYEGSAITFGPVEYATSHEDFPCIVVAPQTTEGWDLEILLRVLEEVARDYSIDESRIYLTGMSTGGDWTWKLAVALPDTFAAIAPVSAGGDLEDLDPCRIAQVPVWAFHNAGDPIYPVENTQALIKALDACGGQTALTIYPSGAHDAWTETYANPVLYAWFLAH